MPNQPRWQPWVMHRHLNWTFKKAIEEYYIEHFLKRTSISLDCEETVLVGDEKRHMMKDMHFTGFGDAQGRFAVLQEDFEGERTWADVEFERDILLRLREFDEVGYHPYLVMTVEDGATDMLPMDLNKHYIQDKFSYIFDWRTYFCTLFDELRAVDELNRQIGMQNCVRLAGELHQEYPCTRAESTSPSAMVGLMRAAGTTKIGLDGRLHLIRRERRCRLGVKSGQLPPVRSNASRLLFERFVRQDEERVAHKLHALQMDCTSAGGYLEW
ncbi:hypothetical protein MW887_003623 [Aspergillus wentii]|nr:hypothetical protein MW887_003623 [Aspergillus wentii]